MWYQQHGGRRSEACGCGQGDRRVKLKDLAKTESVEEKDIKSCQGVDFRPVLL